MKNSLVFVLPLLLYGCSKEDDTQNYLLKGDYDVILVMGQSNTHYGEGLDSALDAPTHLIKQLARFNDKNLTIIEASEPLEHKTYGKNKIGFALTFAKAYANKFLNKDRKLLIIPCGYSNTGFIDNRWNKGNDIYQDAITRTNLVLKDYNNCKLVAILWHQGEKDIDNPNYKARLDNFINNIRIDLNNTTTPFILGGMVPYWVKKSQDRVNVQKLISETPIRIKNTAYANPDLPFVISKNDNEYDMVHYNAIGQRELGKRYFTAYEALVNNE